MRLLLDEDVPQPLLRLLQHLLRGHTVEHVSTRGWKGKKDRQLYSDASKHFDAILTNDISQFNDPVECRAIQRSGLHHITYELADGLDGLALATAAICAAIRPVVAALDDASTQRIVRIHSIARSRQRFEISNPATHPPSSYWP
jgi:PIN like domain